MNQLTIIKIFTHSCMNCRRSLSYIKKIYSRYKRFGLKLILVHPYEWEFERNAKNVKKALRKIKADFPVILDNDRKLIRKLGINWWPSSILIKGKKEIYRHIGEGDYKILEEKIRDEIPAADLKKIRKAYFKEPKLSKIPTVYAGKSKHGKILPIDAKNKQFGIIYADKGWIQRKEFTETKPSSGDKRIIIVGKGRKIYFVAGSDSGSLVKIKSDGKFIWNILVKGSELYLIGKFPTGKRRIIEIETKDELRVYGFSFG